ncbi:hypothetical protein FOL47_005483 [Perkinsus chesapeaki]|uniref:Uncharacterized protein n=1 Tax=Perkinsus chesapeaki TaxID=330153 RepID=A0A7J6LXL3_PERCH|nr:hypothetical protein FOL47_005483 [Perkinsus chesapeaki]
MKLGNRRKGRPPPINTDLYSPVHYEVSDEERLVRASLERLVDENAEVRCRVYDMIDAYEDAFMCCERRAALILRTASSRERTAKQRGNSGRQNPRPPRRALPKETSRPTTRPENGTKLNEVEGKRREVEALKEEAQSLELQARRQRRALEQIGIFERKMTKRNDHLKEYVKKQRREHENSSNERSERRALGNDVEELQAYREDLAAKRSAMESRERINTKRAAEMLATLQSRVSDLTCTLKDAERSARVAKSRLREMKRIRRSAEKDTSVVLDAHGVLGLALAG